jgi:hypothetical protein
MRTSNAVNFTKEALDKLLRTREQKQFTIWR